MHGAIVRQRTGGVSHERKPPPDEPGAVLVVRDALGQVVRTCGLTMTVPGGACGRGLRDRGGWHNGMRPGAAAAFATAGGFAAAVCWMAASARVSSGGGSSARRA